MKQNAKARRPLQRLFAKSGKDPVAVAIWAAHGERRREVDRQDQAKRERDADRWIKSLRIGKALRDACNKRSRP